MTEDEAKTKWCPFTRIAALEGTSDRSSYNRQLDFGPLTEEQLAGPYDPYATGPVTVGLPRAALCIGSTCMAWRWNDTSEWMAKAEAEFRRTGRRIPKTDGYCGLAGRPS